MARPYYGKKQLDAKCNFCRNLEAQLKTEEHFYKFALSKVFSDDDKIGVWLLSQSPFPIIKKKIDACTFPNCDGKCGNNE
jgi:hypothetical protein